MDGRTDTGTRTRAGIDEWMMAVYRFHDIDLARPLRTSRPGPPGPAASESINSQIGRSLPLADAIPWWTIRARRPGACFSHNECRWPSAHVQHAKNRKDPLCYGKKIKKRSHLRRVEKNRTTDLVTDETSRPHPWSNESLISEVQRR